MTALMKQGELLLQSRGLCSIDCFGVIANSQFVLLHYFVCVLHYFVCVLHCFVCIMVLFCLCFALFVCVIVLFVFCIV